MIFLPQFPQYLTHSVALVKLELTILYPLSLECWDDRLVLLCLVNMPIYLRLPYLLGATELVSRKHLLRATCMGVPWILILALSRPCIPLVCSDWPGSWSPAGALGMGSAGSQLPGPPLRTQARRGQPTAPTWRNSCQATHPCSHGISCSQTRSVQSCTPSHPAWAGPDIPLARMWGPSLGYSWWLGQACYRLQSILGLKDDHRNWTH